MSDHRDDERFDARATIPSDLEPGEGEGAALGGTVDVGFDERPFLPDQAPFIDTDRDGLTDYNELVVYQTDPRKRDTDGDGIEDGVEIACLTDPNNAGSPGVGTWVDVDKDLIPDNLSSIPGHSYLQDPNTSVQPLSGSRLVGIDSDNDRVQDFWELAVNHQPVPAGTLVSISDMMSGTLASGGDKRITLGDVNRDGVVTFADAIALLDWVEEGIAPALATAGLNEPVTIRDADVNRDGFVDGSDVTALLNFTMFPFVAPYLPIK